MKLAVITDEQLKEEFLSKAIANDTELFLVKDAGQIPPGTNIIFDLLFEDNQERIDLLKRHTPDLVFVNAVKETLATLHQPFVRINAWPTFLKREVLELTAWPEQERKMQAVLKHLGWAYELVPDISGMVSPRIVSMLINEAYFTLAEKVSTKEEIDIAMRWGTNYPYGPFEWSKYIGLKRINALLTRLSESNESYHVSALLQQEAAL